MGDSTGDRFAFFAQWAVGGAVLAAISIFVPMDDPHHGRDDIRWGWVTAVSVFIISFGVIGCIHTLYASYSSWRDKSRQASASARVSFLRTEFQGQYVSVWPFEDQHVTLFRHGYVIDYLEKLIQDRPWTVFSVEAKRYALNRYQVIPRTRIPFHILPGICTRASEYVDFNEHFRVRLPGGAPNALPVSADVCAALANLRRLCSATPLLSVNRQGVWLGVPGILLDRSDRLAAMLATCRVIDAALLDSQAEPAAEGVRILSVQKSAPGGEEICQVCGEPIRARRVICGRCGLPHHEECWNYMGGCSTYACGSHQRG